MRDARCGMRRPFFGTRIRSYPVSCISIRIIPISRLVKQKGGKPPHPPFRIPSGQLSRVISRTEPDLPALRAAALQSADECPLHGPFSRPPRSSSPQHEIPNLTRRCEARVTRDEVVPVIDFNHITILGMEVGVDDHAAGRSVHRGSLRGNHVDAVMEGALPVERIDAPAVVGRAPAILTGNMVGISFFLALSKLIDDSSMPSLSPRSSSSRVSRSSCCVSSPSDRSHGRVDGARRARHLAEHQVLRLESRHFCEALAERVEPHQLRLHLTQLDGHRIQVLAQVGPIFRAAVPARGTARNSGGGIALGGETKVAK